MILCLLLGLLGCNVDSDRKKGSTDLVLPDDLEAVLWAESPMFYNPTAMDVDAKGRIWVTEAVNYRSFKHDGTNPFHHKEGDRVVILEDTNGDGQADKSTVFVQDKDLQAPVGLAVIGNKVIVSSAPSLIVYTDEDGDDIPDHKEVLLTGFGGYDHDHSLHSVVAGPDGRWNFITGNAGPHMVKDKSGWELRSGSVYIGGTPYSTENTPAMVSDDGRIWTGGLALRMNSDGTGLTVLAHNFRNAYELALDSYGNMWQNDNDDQVKTCRTSFVMEGGNAGYFSADGSRTWKADQRPDQDLFTAHWHQEDPGVMPAGDNMGSGAPTGVAVVESDALGSTYRGMVLSADAGRNLIFGYKPSPLGAGFDLSDRRTFASSVRESTEDYLWNNTDIDSSKWFRPSDVALGTDGAVYIADWYDPIVGGHAMHDTVGYGRIYKVVPKGGRLPKVSIDLRNLEGQKAALLNPAVNVRNAGFTALRKRGDAITPDILSMIEQEENPYHRSRGIWLLAQLGPQGKIATEAFLKAADASTRLVAFRALRSTNSNVLEYARDLAKDPSPAVRRDLAISLRDMGFEKCRQVVMDLVDAYDGKDRWYLEALGTAMDGKEQRFYPLLLERFGDDPLAWSAEMSNVVWRIHPEAAIPALKKRVLSDQVSFEDRKAALVAIAFIPTRAAARTVKEIEKNIHDPYFRDLAGWWLAYRSSNEWAGFYEVDVQKEVLSSEVIEWQKVVTSGEASTADRDSAAIGLAADPAGGRILIQLAAGNLLSVAQKEFIAEYIYGNPDQSVRVLAGEYFKRKGSTNTYSVPDILKIRPHLEKGRDLFRLSCATCHSKGAEGADIGPDLSDIRTKMDRKSLLDAIINPNADIVFGYEPWLITMKDGASHYGFLQSEGDFLVLKDAVGNVTTLEAKDVESRERTRTLMPNPETLGLDEQGLADIVEYLIRG